MTAATASLLVAELPNTKTETIGVTRDLWHGHELVNVRVWFIGQDGEPRPGKQGLAVRVDLASDLARAIGEAAG